MPVKILTILAASWMVSSHAWACGAHPGMSHQQWSSAIAPDKPAKPGQKAEALSSDFFSSRGVSSETPEQGRRRGESGGRRPGRMSR